MANNSVTCCFKKNGTYIILNPIKKEKYMMQCASHFVNSYLDRGREKCAQIIDIINDQTTDDDFFQNTTRTTDQPVNKYVFLINLDDNVFCYYDNSRETFKSSLANLNRFTVSNIYSDSYRLD